MLGQYPNPEPSSLQTLSCRRSRRRRLRTGRQGQDYYRGLNNYLYYFGGSLSQIWDNGPQNGPYIIEI